MPSQIYLDIHTCLMMVVAYSLPAKL